MIKYQNGEKDVFNAVTDSNDEETQDKKKEKVEKGNFVSVNIGASFPISNYGSTSVTSNSGFASTGWFASIEGAYFFIPQVGIGGILGSFGNSVDKAELDRIYSNATVTEYPYYVSIAAGVGPYIQIPTKVVNICFSGTFGALYSIDSRFSVRQGSAEAKQFLRGGFGFVYGGGVNLRFKVSEKLFLTAGSQLLWSEYDTELTMTQFGTSTKSNVENQVQIVSAFLGITFNLSR